MTPLSGQTPLSAFYCQAQEDGQMGVLKDIVFDCRHAGTIARFWAQALDGYEVEPYDQDEIARLRSLGIDDIMDDPGVAIRSMTGAGPRYFFQNVPEPKTAKNRVHIDITAPDRGTEVARLISLGATVFAEYDDWTTLLDPEGNEFCVMEG
jgi:hypothetical protein